MTTPREDIAMIRMRVHSDSLLGDWLREYRTRIERAAVIEALDAMDDLATDIGYATALSHTRMAYSDD